MSDNYSKISSAYGSPASRAGFNLPDYYLPHRPHSCRRASFHNYCGPGKYMISITKDESAPLFSLLEGNPIDADNPVRVVLSAVGSIIESQILRIEDDENFEISNYCIMPDHIHILWRVKYWLPKDLGYYVGLFKSRCTKTWRERNAEIPNIENKPLFMAKFNDRIAFDEKMEVRFFKYIADNPRRRLLRMLYPQIFRKAQRIKMLDYEMDIFGNFQLLKHPLLASAVVSSRYTDEERKYYSNAWEEAIRGGGVLISPFISGEEKILMRRILEAGGSIIRIVADGMGPRYKPSGKEFDLCAEGRCLHIGMPRESMHVDAIKRKKCLALNELARWIASHPAETLKLIGARRALL